MGWRPWLALLPGVAAAWLVLAACEEGGGPSPTPTPSPAATATASPTPAEEMGGMEGFRAFAPQLEAALEAGNLDFFVEVAEISTATCPNEFLLRCEGQPEGSTIDGILLGRWGSEGSLLTVDDFRADLEEYLASLSHPQLYAIASLNRDMGGVIGGPAVLAIVTSAEEPTEFVRVFEFVGTDDTWRLRMMILVGGPLAAEWLSGDCTDCYDYWERYP